MYSALIRLTSTAAVSIRFGDAVEVPVVVIVHLPF
jgi:hypothetical protein